MRERPADTAQAIVLAVLVHGVLVAILLAGLWMKGDSAPTAAAGGMAADVVDVGQLSTAMQRTLRNRPEPLPDPVPEPDPESEPEPEPAALPPTLEPVPQPRPQEQLPKPEPVNQDEVVAQPTPVKARETKVQEEKRRQEQVDLSAERERQAQAEARRKQQEAEAQSRRLEEQREQQLAEIRRKRAAAAREARLAEERLEQLQAARSGSPAEEAARSDAAASGAGGDDGLKARYAAALQEAVRAKWTRPESIPAGALCRLEIRQLPGGEVVDVEVRSPCVYDEQGRRSIEAAVLKAQPLPYAGFEKVFSRTLILNFRAE